MQVIEARINKDHSPEQITGRLRLEYPDSPAMQISHETIYQYLNAKMLNGSLDLRLHLRQGRKKQRKRIPSKENRGTIPSRRFIDERPSIVDLEKAFWQCVDEITFEGKVDGKMYPINKENASIYGANKRDIILYINLSK